MLDRLDHVRATLVKNVRHRATERETSRDAGDERIVSRVSRPRPRPRIAPSFYAMTESRSSLSACVLRQVASI